jgi:PAS domain S-box-containing protein
MTNRMLLNVIDWQGLVVEITNTLMKADTADLDHTIRDALRLTGELAGSDRTHVFRLRDPARLDNTHEWVADGIDPVIDELQDISADILVDWIDELNAGQSIYIPDVADLPQTSVVKDELLSQGIKSLLAVPMLRNGRLRGFVGYDAVCQYRSFLPAEIQLLQSVANTLNVVIELAAAEAAEATARRLLKDETDRLRATMAAIPDLLLETDREGRFVSVNVGSWLQPYRPPEDYIGNMLEDVLPRHISKLAREAMAIVDRDGRSSGHEYQASVNNELLWYQLSVSKIHTTNEFGYLFLVRDITQSHRQQQQILRLGKIAELTSNLVVVTDPKDRIEWVNPAFERRSGWRLDEVVGKTVESFLLTSAIDRAKRERIRRAIREGKGIRTELLNKAKSVEEYWTSVDINSLQADDRGLTGFVAVHTDITEMKQSLARELQDRAIAIEEASDGIALVNSDTFFTYTSPAYRTLFGICSKEDISSLNLVDFYPVSLVEEQKELSSGGVWRAEALAVLRDGIPFPHALSLSRRALGGYVVIAHNSRHRIAANAERTRLNDEFNIAQRRNAIAELATGVAHDLSNLVFVVDGASDLIEMLSSDNAEILAGTQRIKRATGMARELMSSLGRFDRPNALRTILDLRVLARQVRGLLGGKRISEHAIKITAPVMYIPVWANGIDVQQVLVNLAINACDAKKGETNIVNLTILPKDATAPESKPNVGELCPNRHYSFAVVSDTAGGIYPKHRAKLFKRYFTTKGDKGTGLGLPIVATILSENDAVLWLDSTFGLGTIATIAWPSAPKNDSIVSHPGRLHW